MSAPPPSLVVVGNASPHARPLRFLTAYGDLDDPLRLTVLLAEHCAALVPAQGGDEDVRVCQSRNASWSDRRDALRRLLARACRKQQGYFVGLTDFDALKPERHESWEDAYSLRTRKEFFSTLLEAIDRGGWVILRPSLSRSASSDLVGLDTEVVKHGAQDDGLADIKQALSFVPECWPVLAWLLQEHILRPRDLADIVDTVEDFDAHVLAIAYDALPASARDTAKVLSTVRPALHLNGALGAFQFSQELGASTVSRRAVECLRRCGFLQPAAEGNGDTVRMPRFVRSMLLAQGRFSLGDMLKQTHEWLASQPDAQAPTDEQIEIHFHAVQAGNVERAVSTARFYGIELRELATELSRRGRFSEAARLFELLVNEFDSQDPYGWEYLGYNLARAHGARERVLDAYQRACRLAPNNPLYHGRLLGFRGELGQDISAEFERRLEQYILQYGAQEEAVAYFAEATLKGLRRGRQHEQLRQLLSQWHSALEQFAPRVLRMVRSDPPADHPLDA